MSKLNWGMIGGGEGSQIGPAHRLGSGLDGDFAFAAGALDHNPEAGRAYAQNLGVAADRAYGDWREMLAGESARDDRVDLVTVATPNATHFEITREFLSAGFNVLCEKPMTMTVEEGEEIVRIAQKSGRICAVNYGYTGYSAGAPHAGDGSAGGIWASCACCRRRVRTWPPRRMPPMQTIQGCVGAMTRRKAGVSAQFADCGIHALHMASFVTGQEVEKLSADFASTISSRTLEDDAMVNFRMDGGAVGRLWTSSVAVGRMHGLAIQVFGERGGLRWAQEQPNQLIWTPTGGRNQIIERGEAGLSPEADRATRVTIGHAEGMPLAFANIYKDLAEAIRAQKEGRAPDPAADLYPARHGWLAVDGGGASGGGFSE